MAGHSLSPAFSSPTVTAMSRKPIAIARNGPQPAADGERARFAALLTGHLAGGTRPRTMDGEPWTDAESANEIPGREKDAMSSPNRVANWRRGLSLPTEIEPILRALFGPTRNFDNPAQPHPHAEARAALRDALFAARDERNAVIAAVKVIETASDDPAGLIWIVEGDHLVIDRATGDANLRAATTAISGRKFATWPKRSPRPHDRQTRN